ncbi:MAG: polyprenyl synthetase family protein, partial [Bacteroidota bacterium]
MNKVWLHEIEQAIEGLSLPNLPQSLYQPFSYTMAMGGKRIRPYVTLLACGMVSGDHKHAMPASLAVEVLHNFTLL